MPRKTTRLIVIAFCALGFASSDARADILELLKTHKIVVGDGCIEKGSNPCTPPPMNPRSEFRLVNDLIINLSLETQTGFIYPVNREEDILNHPLMAEFYRRQSIKHYYAKTRAMVSGQTLFLARKESYGDKRGNAIQSAYETRVTVSNGSCLVVFYEATKSSGGAMRPKLRYLCTLVPLEAGVATDGPKVKTLSFTRINRAFAGKQQRETQTFALLADRLHYTFVYCDDSSRLAVDFDWRGGALKGTHSCQYSVGGRANHYTVTYSSAAKVDGNARHVTASGIHENKGYAPSKMSFEFDVRFVLDGGKCRIEKYYRKDVYGGSGSPFIFSADAQSECHLE